MDNGESIAELVFLILYLAVLVLMAAGAWKMFEKANQPGWGVLIPVYNLVLLLRVGGKPLWWLILMIIPIVSIIPMILIPMAIARNFGKGGGYAIGLIFLPFIFYPMLGFGSAEYCPSGLPFIGQTAGSEQPQFSR